MDDIARHLSVSKKTLYQHFADKEDIVTMACKAHLERNSKEFEGIKNAAKNAIGNLSPPMTIFTITYVAAALSPPPSNPKRAASPSTSGPWSPPTPRWS